MPLDEASDTETAVFLPYQRDYLNNQASVLAVEKSRRIGLTWCDAADSVITAASNHGEDVLYVSYNEEFSREYLELCKEWALKLDAAASEIDEVLVDKESDLMAFRTQFPSRRKILGMSSFPRNLRGKQGKVIIDEAAFHNDLEGLLKAGIAMLIWGGRLRIISTHNGRHSDFNKMLKQIRSGELPYEIQTVTFDQAVTDGLYERIQLMQTGTATSEGKQEWVESIYAAHGRNADEELRVRPSSGGNGIVKREWLKRYVYPANRYSRLILSLDTASKTKRTNSPSVATVIGQKDMGYDMLYMWREWVEYPDLKRNVIALAQRFMPDALLIEDKSSGQALIQELRADPDFKTPIIAIMPLLDKQTRFEAVAHHFEAGMVYVPETAFWLPDFEAEITEFPNVAYTDICDSVSQGLTWLYKGAGQFDVLAGATPRDSVNPETIGTTGAGWGSVTVARPF